MNPEQDSGQPGDARWSVLPSGAGAKESWSERKRRLRRRRVLFGSAFVGVVFTAMLLVLVFGFRAFRSAEPCRVALERAGASPPVVRMLGEPLEIGWLVRGKIKGPRARFTLPVHGPRGRGSIHGVAVRTDGAWQFSILFVTFAATGEQHSLLESMEVPAPEGGATAPSGR